MTNNGAEGLRDPAGEVLAELLAVAAAASDETAVVNEAPSDRTVVVNQVAREALREAAPDAVAGDRTVVVNQPQAGAPSRAADPGASADLAEDGTVVAAAPTEVAPGSRRGRRGREESFEHAPSGSRSAPVVSASREKRAPRRIVGEGLDPRRPIAEAPGSLPWEVQSVGERGVAQGLPVSYGARVQTDMPLAVGLDEVQRRVGLAPEASPVEVAQGRELLPSLRRRDRKRGLLTLLAYAGLTVSCAAGLWGVASIAFGW